MPTRLAARRPKFSPASLSGKGMAFWYDARDTAASGSAVSLWRDRSPVRADMNTATGTITNFQYGHVGQKSGERSISGDASSAYISATGVTNPIDGSQFCHIFIAVTRSSPGGNYWFSMPRGAGNNGIDMDDWRLDFYTNGLTQIIATPVTAQNGLPVILEIYFDAIQAGVGMLFLAGDPVVNNIQGTAINLSSFGQYYYNNFSSGFNSPGGPSYDIHELIGFAQTLHGEDRKNIIRYLREKWGAIPSADKFLGNY